MAEHAHTTATSIIRRAPRPPAGGVTDRRLAALPAPDPKPKGRRKPPAKVGGVAVEQKLPADAVAIVAEVRGETQQQSADLTARMQALVVQMREMHREHAQKLVAIGIEMDRPMLDDFIEIGRRLLAGSRRS